MSSQHLMRIYFNCSILYDYHGITGSNKLIKNFVFPGFFFLNIKVEKKNQNTLNIIGTASNMVHIYKYV